MRQLEESYVGPWLPEPLLTAPDVAEDVALADSVSMVILLVLVLETLTPAERAVFVLREVFDLVYDEIAEAVGKSPAPVRQIAHRDLHALGVPSVAIPRQAPVSPARKTTEHSRGFRWLVKWRTESEGRISYLEHVYGWDPTRLDGKAGAAIWCGHGAFATTWSKSRSSASDQDQAQAHGVAVRIPASAQTPAQAFFSS